MNSRHNIGPKHGAWRSAWLMLWVLAGTAGAQASVVSIAIEGLKRNIEKSARENLTLNQYTDREVIEQEVQRLVTLGNEEIRTSLEAFGYYNPSIESKIERADGGNFRAIFEVAPGDPTIVRDAEVKVDGAADDEKEVRSAVEAFEPKKGDRLVHSVYEKSKHEIATALRSTGFLDAKTTASRVEVTSATNSADIHLIWEGGERYRLGRANFSKAQFSDKFLQGFVPWENGAYYSSESLLTLQERLVSADYFGSVSVQPNFERAENRVVPVDVVLIPDERTVYTAGLFLSTDFGPGGRLGVDRRWLNQQGHKARGEVAYAPRLKEASINYQIPRPGEKQRDYNFGVGYTDEKSEAAVSRTMKIAAAEAHRRWRGFTRSFGLQYLNGDFEIAGQRGSTSVLYADAALSRQRTDDQRFTRRGYAVRFALRGAPEFFLSKTAFLQFQAAGKWIRAIGDDGRITLRGDLGAMAVGDFNDFPPALRFFAGGDRSIRGFGYEAIGDTNRAGGVIGGEYLITTGVEYEHFFLGNWGAATFVDAGDAFRSNFNVNVSAGVGLRWKSPIGLVRLDVARPVVSERGETWRVHVVIGPD